MTSLPDLQQLRAGLEVVDADGERVGAIVDRHERHLHVAAGLLFAEDRYIPLEAVSRIVGDRVYLNVAADRIAALGWDRLPSELSATPHAESQLTPEDEAGGPAIEQPRRPGAP